MLLHPTDKPPAGNSVTALPGRYHELRKTLIFRVYIANILLLPLLLTVSQVDVHHRTGCKVTNL